MSGLDRMRTPAFPPPHRSVRWWGLILLAAAIPLAGEAFGHGYFSRIGDSLSHHALHAVTVIIASALFWLLIANDITRHGVPPRLRGLHRAYRSLRSAMSFHC